MMKGAVRIVSDRNIPFVAEAFGELGEVVCLPASQIDAAAVRDADLLLCRSTLKVGPALLEGSRVRFVGTAVIGTDHLDLRWLAERGITWASAPGSNADSVALWWTAALVRLCLRQQLDPGSLRIGVVGVGHVGSRVARLAHAFGHAPLLCDPPRARAEGSAGFVALDAVLEGADVVTLHVPLASDGPDPTRGMVSAAHLARMKPGAVLVNTCRGEVVDGDALERALTSGRLRGLFDVYLGEPSPSPALVGAAVVATPHIAGHSLDGKVNGTDAIYRAACAFLGRLPTFDVKARLPPPVPEQVVLDPHGHSDAEVLDQALRPYYDIAADDAALRRIVALPEGERGPAFRAYRDAYAARREPRGVTLLLEQPRGRVNAVIGALGMIPARRAR
jgi:erythronate-4-phosphate dehydrogenase